MARRSCLFQQIIATVLIAAVYSAPSDKKEATNVYDPEFGVYLGQLASTTNALVSGRLFVVNETTLQVIGFSYNGKPNDAYFWLSKTETPAKDGLKLPTFEFGFTPLETADNLERIVLKLPTGHRITEYKSLAVYSPTEKSNYGSVQIPDDVLVPKSHFLLNELIGSRYSVRSGPILILDTRTIKIFAFTFDGDKAPDGYFFVGRGLNVAPDAGTKVPIRGRDTPNSITPMNERYRGGQDIIIDLPEGYDVYHIDLLSVYCYKFRVDFAHVAINNLPVNLPPYVPIQNRSNAVPKSGCDNVWKPQPLLGTEARSNFTLQLGPPGGACGYRAITGLRPLDYVWYVNGYLAEIYLKRGLNYTFIIEGGLNNSFYLSDEQFGGYSKLEPEEREQVTVFAPKDNLKDEYGERLCLWAGVDPETSDKFGTFEEFRQNLHLNCVNVDNAKMLHFTPTNSTPSTIYGNSFGNYAMGFKINVVDQLPADIPDIQEQPFTFEAWTHSVNKASTSVLTNFGFFVCSLLLLNRFF